MRSWEGPGGAALLTSWGRRAGREEAQRKGAEPAPSLGRRVRGWGPAQPLPVWGCGETPTLLPCSGPPELPAPRARGSHADGGEQGWPSEGPAPQEQCSQKTCLGLWPGALSGRRQENTKQCWGPLDGPGPGLPPCPHLAPLPDSVSTWTSVCTRVCTSVPGGGRWDPCVECGCVRPRGPEWGSGESVYNFVFVFVCLLIWENSL